MKYIINNDISVTERVQGIIQKKFYMIIFVAGGLEVVGYVLHMRFNTLISDMIVVFCFIAVIPLSFFYIKLRFIIRRLIKRMKVWSNGELFEDKMEELACVVYLIVMVLYNIGVVFKIIFCGVV